MSFRRPGRPRTNRRHPDHTGAEWAVSLFVAVLLAVGVGVIAAVGCLEKIQ